VCDISKIAKITFLASKGFNLEISSKKLVDIEVTLSWIL